MDVFFFWFLPLWAVFGVVGVLIARPKNIDKFVGCFWGILLGPIGWLVLSLMSPKGRKCPHCAEHILGEAQVCKHCGRDVEPLPVSQLDTTDDEMYVLKIIGFTVLGIAVVVVALVVLM